jgi:CHAT domain-containing protein
MLGQHEEGACVRIQRANPTRVMGVLNCCRLLLLWVSVVAADRLMADVVDPREAGQRAFEKGAFSQAITNWQEALTGFRERKDVRSEVRTLMSLANAYQAIGHQRRAVEILEEALGGAGATGDEALTMRVKGTLGGALVMTMESDRAAVLLQEALEGARAGMNGEFEAEVLNEMGNLFVTQGRHGEGLVAYQASVDLGRQVGASWVLARALCNAAVAAASMGDVVRAEELNTEALQEIDRLEPSHAKAFLLLTAGQTDGRLRNSDGLPGESSLLRAHRSLGLAMELAEELEDGMIETYALGYLARLYEMDGQHEVALTLSRRAAFVAQQARMPEALYRWEWDSARLMRDQGDIEGAIAAYRRAVQVMEPIRNDVSLGYGNAAGRRSFRESEGPLFFELADLLLQLAEATEDRAMEQRLLLEARDTVEYLKAVELEDYFCDDCVDVQRSKTRSIEAVDQHTAVVYFIPLPERTEVLVGLASGLKRFTLEQGAETLTSEVHRFRRNLETRTTYAYLEQAQVLYDWLIRPILGLLRESGIQTLVFVPDGALRTIPFASLHDGERFLIQELAVAVAPGLSLVEPRPIERGKARVLLNGLSESVQGFPPLDFVVSELRSLEPLFPGETLFNEGFTLSELTRRLTQEQYSMIHIASHGQFDRDVRKTFVLTYDGKLTLNDLEALIRPSQYRGRPVELLVLSACQTAAGDDRAAMGLAGVAIKAGARSALATLWFVNDQSTSALVTEVYNQLRHSPSVSKARALQAAQLALLSDRRYRHPCYWSPYLIIGNWL